MAFRKIDPQLQSQSPEDVNRDAVSPSAATSLCDLAFPNIVVKNDVQTWLKLFPIPEPHPASPYIFVRRVHRFSGKIKLCTGETCINDSKRQMPCARALGIYREIKPYRNTFRAERDAQQKTGKRLGQMTDEMYAWFAGEDKTAKTLMYTDWHFYPAIECVVRHDKLLPFPECWNEYEARNTDRTDQDCVECPYQRSCKNGVSIFHCRYSDDDKSTGKKLVNWWNKSTERRESVFNTEPDGNGNCQSRLVSILRTQPGEFPSWTFDGTDAPVAIPGHVMKKVSEMLGDQTMSQMVDPFIRVSEAELLRLAQEAVDFPFGKNASEQQPAQVGPPSVEQATKATATASTPQAESPLPPPQDKTLEQSREALISDPKKRTDVFDRTLNERIPVCRGNYHDPKEWPKCDVDLPAEERCPIIVACKQESVPFDEDKPVKKAKKKATAAMKPEPEPELEEQQLDDAGEGDDPIEGDAKADAGDGDEQMNADEWAEANGVTLPNCFGDPKKYRPGKGRACIKCAEKHQKVVDFCAEEVEQAKQFE